MTQAKAVDTAVVMADQESRRRFWTGYQPGFRFTHEPIGTREFFDAVERHRYSLEPHIREMVRFEQWVNCDVLEAGCGIGTDGINFGRHGARYTGVDFSDSAVSLAKRRFEMEDVPGQIIQASIAELPVPDESQDLVYSNGVIHHMPERDRALAVSEMYRVLRPGGRALVLVYHRNSLNYWINIMLLRRALAPLVLLPKGPEAIARLTGEAPEVVAAHRLLFRRHRLQYLTNRQLFLNHNTDGPGNPLSIVITRQQAHRLFEVFADVQTQVRALNLRLYPGGSRLAGTTLGRRLERRYGWALWVTAIKPR